MGEHPDVALLRVALSGDRRAKDQLVARVGPLIEAGIQQVVARHRQLGINGFEDLTQQVWLRLYDGDAHRLQKFDPGKGTLEGYIFTVAHRIILDLVKGRNGRMQLASLSDVELADASPSAEERTAFRELARSMRRHLDSVLPPRGQLVLRLLYDDGRADDEVAEIMGVSHQVVANWKHKIKKHALEFRENYR